MQLVPIGVCSSIIGGLDELESTTAVIMIGDLKDNVKLGIIGCGTMGKCIMSALFDSGTLKHSQVYGSVYHDESIKNLQTRFPEVRFTTNNIEVVKWANAILICLKPQIVEEFVNEPLFKHTFKGKIIISIAAGIKLFQYEEWLPDSQVIRAIPNTPCQIRAGMVVMSASTNLDPSTRNLVLQLFNSLGKCRFVSDCHMDAVTALSGSGPAFACIILEALADGGVMMGLARDVAVELAAQSLQGAARMVLETGMHPAKIKDTVTTPGGCTIAGILTMEDGKIRSVLARTIEEATIVASTLGKKK